MIIDTDITGTTAAFDIDVGRAAAFMPVHFFFFVVIILIPLTEALRGELIKLTIYLLNRQGSISVHPT